MKKRILSILSVLALLIGAMASLAGCGGGGGTPNALVIMSEDLDGLFNPFFYTTGPDGTIVGMTQMSMLTVGYENEEAVVAAGDDHAVAVKDYSIRYDAAKDETVYTFVMKNGVKFSDGKPMTMNDVLFNMYVYLDPVYTGSNTMYSTDIKGLQNYRNQTVSSGDSSSDAVAEGAATLASNRLKELVNLFMQVGKTDTAGTYFADETAMKAAIAGHSVSSGYKNAISNNPAEVTNKNLLADYELALRYFREELETDYASAKEAYTEEPYKSTGEFDEVTSFMYAEGYVMLEYAEGADGKIDRTKIKEVRRYYNNVTDMASAIEYVYQDKVSSSLHEILSIWATARRLETEYLAKAKEVILRQGMTDGNLLVPNISGIVSLGHSSDVTEVQCNNGTYTVAHTYNEDGTVANAEEYAVLEITINGVDPKAIWNFAFTVAPQHYYAPGYEVDILNNKFGVEFGSYDFMRDVIQSSRNVKVPMGAGAYVATDRNDSDNPNGNDFFRDNVVYFKASEHFLMGAPKIERIRYQIISASNALSALEAGTVHYVTPQFTQANIDKINSLKSKGIEKMSTSQLGYGYIGINAGLVPDINLRRAIMAAMDTSLALSYYSTGMAERIYWPMSTVSWAYPKTEDGKNDRDNGHSYPAPNWNREDAKEAILAYMENAGVSAGSGDLKIKFTIAGSNLTDHPTYQTFQAAADLLNECGWDVEVVPDAQALTKLATGSLAVWAAAWGSTVDPDLYQVYHKNSSATSTLAWGYREILETPGQYVLENQILSQLSAKIDEARETNDQAVRTQLYKEAMSLILDLSVELPVYQRAVLYAYNANVIDPNSLPDSINPYSSPLDKIWELEFKN